MARSPARRVVATITFLVAIVALLAFYFILFADAQQVPGVPGAGDAGAVAAVITIVFVAAIIVMVVLLISGAGDDARGDPFYVPEDEVPHFEDVEDDLVVYDIHTIPVAERAWGGQEDMRTHSFYFPMNVEAGVYVNDYIPLTRDDDGPRIKLRTLLAGPADVEAATFIVPDQFGAPARSSACGTFHAEPEPVEDPDVYLDYRGDEHPVSDVEGIGRVYTERLARAGVKTIARLCYEDATQLAHRIDVPGTVVRSWQGRAQLMKVSGIGPQYAEALERAGVDGIESLRQQSPARIAQQVTQYLDSLDTSVVGTRISERRVAGWQEAAKGMQRVRQSIPVE